VSEELTAEYAQGYMDGVTATRDDITKMINLEMTSRETPPPLPIKYWTEYLLDMINSNGRDRQEIIEEAAGQYLRALLMQLVEQEEEEEE
jgi:hypothetical protein